MLTLTLMDKNGEAIASRTRKEETYLAFKTREYCEGEKIVLEVSKPDQFVWVQVDEAIEPSLIYLEKTNWVFPIILNEESRRAYSPKIFSGERHYIRAWLPKKEELNYRNLARNAHDQKQHSYAYPHVFANVETRNDSTFFARNAIDGMIANESHGSYPYQSWGINQQKDAHITIDFGRNVKIDCLSLVLRGDYPHDSYWTQITIDFDGEIEMDIFPTNSMERQDFSFEPRIIRKLILKNLIKHEDDSPFPALTQLEVYGKEVE